MTFSILKYFQCIDHVFLTNGAKGLPGDPLAPLVIKRVDISNSKLYQNNINIQHANISI